MEACDPDSVRNLNIRLKIAATLPMTPWVYKRLNSTDKRANNYTRFTMGESRSLWLALTHSKYDIPVDF